MVCFGGSTVSLGFRFLDVAFGAGILEIAYGCDSEIFIEIPGQVSGICCWETYGFVVVILKSLMKY